MLTQSETDDVLMMLDRLCAKQGWKSYQRRLVAIRARVASAVPLPAGSIIDPDTRPDPFNFKPCPGCDSPSRCSEWDGCGRGK